jgi:hypothetical protein
MAGPMDGLKLLRIIFLTMAGSHLVLLTALPSVLPEEGGSVSPLFLWLTLFSGLYGVGGALWARSRPVELSSPESLAGSYRANFFIGVAMAHSAGLIGYSVSFIVGAVWPYLIGLVFAAIGLIITAPTRGNLNRRQRQITAQGSPLSLLEALKGSPPGSWPFLSR